MMQHRVVVQEEGYAVVARVSDRDENGEEVPRSDRMATALRLVWSVKARGRNAQVIEDEEGLAAIVELGDAPDSEFEETAGTLLGIASSW